MKSHMLLASQNMLNYDLMLPKDIVFSFCDEENILLLRTVGVMFSDDEKRTTQYEK